MRAYISATTENDTHNHVINVDLDSRVMRLALILSLLAIFRPNDDADGLL